MRKIVRHRFRPVACGLWVGLLTCAAALAAPPAEVMDGWEAMARVQFVEARDAFEARLASDPADHRARIGLAAALLNVQPRLDGNITRAASLLEQVRSSATGDDAIEATYLLARIHQVHLIPADPQKAVQIFDQLYAAHADHPLAQMGFVKSAMLRLYVLADGPSSATFTAIEERAASLTDPAAKRDFHLTMATAASQLQLGDAAALRHLEAAIAVGVAKRKTAADLYVRAATLARALGQPMIAQAYERQFLQEFPRDNRAFTIRRRMETAPAQPSEAGR